MKNAVRIGLQKPINLIVGANSFPVRENFMSITELREQNKSCAHSSIYTQSNETLPQKQQKCKISFEFLYSRD